MEELSVAMWDSCAFVQEADALQKAQLLRATTMALAQQIAECAYFIRDYMDDPAFGRLQWSSRALMC